MKKVEISDKSILEKILSSNKGLCCEYSFANLFIWGDIYDTRWELKDGTLYIFYAEENSLLMPIPSIPPKKLAEIPDLFSIPRKNLYINHTSDEYINTNKEIFTFFEIVDDDDFVDYVHLIDRLVELKGTKLAKKKNLISQFVRNYPEYQCVPITKNLKTTILEFSEKWLSQQHATHLGLEHEKLALHNAIKHFEELSLEGLAIFAENEICAFSIFSRQNDETYIEHFEKASPEIKGSAQIINMETAKYLRNKAKFLNREQDIGIPGLKKAKLSYDPDIRIGGKTLKYIN